MDFLLRCPASFYNQPIKYRYKKMEDILEENLSDHDVKMKLSLALKLARLTSR